MQTSWQSLSRRSRALFRTSPRDIVTAIGPSAFLLLLGLVIAYLFIDPAPPSHLLISTGSEDSAYQDFAKRYQEILARDHITLEILPSAGALANVQQLRAGSAGINIGFAQDGLNSSERIAGAELLSLGSIAYEPIWLFYRGNKTLSRLSELQGKRIAIGQPGSGTERFAQQLLTASGVNAGRSRLLPIGRDKANEQLQQGKIDAAFFVGAPDSALIRSLLGSARVRPMSFDQAAATVLQFPFLHHLVLPHGTVDLLRNLPRHDLHLLATTTTLVAHNNLHPALVALLMKALGEVHSAPTLLSKKHEFPSDKDDDFRLDPDAAHFYQSGPPLLQRYLPFWIANFIDRTLIFFLPLLALLIPLTKAVPQIYSWRIKTRIYRWYGELKFLETQLRSASEPHDYTTFLTKVDWIEEQVSHTTIPLSFSEHFYLLKEHIDLVRRKILRAKTLYEKTLTAE